MRRLILDVVAAISAIILFAISPSRSFAQEENSSVADSTKPLPSLNITRREGAITIDGDLNDEGWKHAAHVSDFTEVLPNPNQKPHAATEAYMTYDDKNIYVAMIAHDDNPSAIRASLTGRDGIFNDDFMGIIVDTYGDATRAFEIYVNPKGVQGDLLWSENNEDDSYDMIYESQAKMTADGYQIEFRVPLRSLRFPNKPVQDWHLTFWRSHPRDQVYKYSWSSINFFNPCTFCQLGRLTGIENVKSPDNLEFLPSVTAHQSASANDSHTLVNDKAKVDLSLGARYDPSASSSIEATVNPDFSQVEADASQIDANTTFALYYPERRPFFQEGSELLETYVTAVYTRSINNPLAAAKAVYREGTDNLAYIGAYDRSSPVIIPLEERSVVAQIGGSTSNILRELHTFGDYSNLGFLATDRRYDQGGSNTLFGADTRLLLFENVEFQGQALFAHTKEANDTGLVSSALTFDDNKHTVRFDGEEYWGNLMYAALQRYTRGLDVRISAQETSPEFRAANGFITANDHRSATFFVGYKFPLQHAIIKEFDLSLSPFRGWNYDGTIKDDGILPWIDVTLPGQTSLHAQYQWSFDRYAGIDFHKEKQFSGNISTRFWKPVSVGLNYTYGDAIARNLDVPILGKETDISGSTTIRPTSNFTIQPSYTYSKLDSATGGNIFEGAIYHVRLNYQFTRELSARVVAEYDSFDDEFFLDSLVTYQLNPFSTFYVGSAHNLESVSDSTSKSLQPTGRQFFAKFQYLFQI